MTELSPLFSVGLILLLGFIAGYSVSRINIPGLVGMIVVGLILGPEIANIINEHILNLSPDLRAIALIIILFKSGLNLDIESLKQVGRPAILLSFVPAIFEIIGNLLSGMWLLDLSVSEGLLLGSILSAVSPAVVNIRMIHLIEKRYGEKHQIPKLILAGSALDDIFVIILFYSFLSLVENDSFNVLTILGIPISVILGTSLGLIIGFPMLLLFSKAKFDNLTEVLILFALNLIFDGFEEYIDEKTKNTDVHFISVSGLLAVIVVGILIFHKNPEKSKVFSSFYTGFWKFFEIILFVLVGTTLEFNDEFKESIGKGIVVLLIGLVLRSIGCVVSLLGVGLNWKEYLFVILTYMGKATVQASIGGIAQTKGLKCGNLMSAISIISIIITAPACALCIDLLHPYLLDKNDDPPKKDINQIKEDDNKNENQSENEEANNRNVLVISSSQQKLNEESYNKEGEKDEVISESKRKLVAQSNNKDNVKDEIQVSE